MKEKWLKTEEEYGQALKEVEVLLIADEAGVVNHSESDRLEQLLVLIKDYEREHWAI